MCYVLERLRNRARRSCGREEPMGDRGPCLGPGVWGGGSPPEWSRDKKNLGIWNEGYPCDFHGFCIKRIILENPGTR